MAAGFARAPQPRQCDQDVDDPASVARAQAHPKHLILRTKNHPPAPPPLTFRQRLVEHFAFQAAINVAIAVNAVQMGVAVDVRGPPWDYIWQVCEHFFTIVFFLEMTLKIWAHGLGYIRDPWNIFDFGICWISVFATWVQPFLSQDKGGLSVIRLLRLLRLLRMMKLMRVIPQFRIVFDGISQAMQSMFWVVLLGLFIMYMAAVACVVVVGRNDSGFPDFDDVEDTIMFESSKEFNNYQYFGTVMRSMLSLFNLVVMAELDSIIRPLWEVQTFTALLIICLVFIMTFGFLNILVGMIMDNVMATVRELDMERDFLLKRSQMDLSHELCEVMYEMDDNGDGTLSKDETAANLQKESSKLQKILDGLLLPHNFSMDDLFVMLDADGSGDLSRDEFLDGMFRLVLNTQFQRDCIMQLSIGQIKKETQKIQSALAAELGEMREQFKNLNATVTDLLGCVCSEPKLAARAPCTNSAQAPKGGESPSLRPGGGKPDVRRAGFPDGVAQPLGLASKVDVLAGCLAELGACPQQPHSRSAHGVYAPECGGLGAHPDASRPDATAEQSTSERVALLAPNSPSPCPCRAEDSLQLSPPHPPARRGAALAL